MLDQETKRKIDSARNILVGKVPDPKAQVEQITTALIYKFMDDMDKETVELGGKAGFFVEGLKEYAWSRLLSRELSGQERLDLYTRAINELAKAKEIPELFRMIFKDAYLPYRDAETLNLFLKEINNFTYENSESLGNAFEYLLSVLGSQGDAGQFRTPRHIIDFIVEVVDPKKTERILDPACGTAGFLISAYKHIKRIHSSNYKEEGYVQTFAETDNRDITTVEIQKNGKYKGDLLTPDDRKKIAQNIVGYDISPDMVRLSLVNLYLHGFSSPQIFEYDSLTYEDRWDENFDVILANPPFMTPKGGIRPHKHFQIQANRAEVLFVDYIAEHLKVNGRAGIIVPEGIIFQSSGAYKNLRKMLVDDGYLWAVVSLPSGVFNPYSGVKTSILFLDRELAKKSDEVLFAKVENDGFDLGAQRRRIDQNDLPRAFEVIKKFEKVIRGEKKHLTYGDVQGIAHTVKKEEIVESGDYSLSGEKYRKDLTVGLRESMERMTELLKPYQGMFDSFTKQAQAHQKQIDQIQESVKPFLRYVNEQQEMINELYAHLSEPIKRMQKAFESSAFKSALEAAENLQKMVQGNQYPMVELGDDRYFTIESGGTPDSKNPQYWNGDVNWATLVDLPAERFITELTSTQRKITKVGLENSSAKLLPPKTILVSTRATIGRIAVSDIPIATNQGFKNIVIKDFTSANEKYVAYAVLNLVPEMLKQASGGTFKEISKSSFSKLKIPLPPLEVQKQIVDQIEVKQNAIDAAREVIRNLERERRYFGQELKRLEGIEWVELGEVTEINPKKSEVQLPKNTMVSFVPMECLNEHEMAFSPKEERPLEDVYGGYTYFKDGDVLLAKVTPCFENGKAGIANRLKNGIGFGSSEFIVIRPSKRILPEIIYYILSSKEFTEGGTQCMTGTGGLKRIPREFVESYKIPVPSMEVQQQLVEEIRKEWNVVEANKSLIATLEEKIKNTISSLTN